MRSDRHHEHMAYAGGPKPLMGNSSVYILAIKNSIVDTRPKKSEKEKRATGGAVHLSVWTLAFVVTNHDEGEMASSCVHEVLTVHLPPI